MDSSKALSLSAADVEKLPAAEALQVLQAHVKAKKKELAEALAGSKSKELARAAKKALYQLKSSGVAVAEAAPKGEAVELPKGKGLSEFPALMTPALGTGERVIFFGRQQKGGLEIFQGVIHDEHGVQQLDRAEASRSAFRKRLRELSGSNKVIEVPLPRVLEELGRAWGRNLKTKTPLNAAMLENLRSLGVKMDETELELPKPENTDEETAADAHALHDEPEIGEWLPPQEHIATLAEATLKLEQEKAERPAMVAAATKAAQDLFLGPVRRVYARRLWEMAEFLEGTNRPGPGRLARAEARLLFHHPSAIGGFSKRLFEKLIGLAAGATRSLPPPMMRKK